jgi:hypothetical protein
MTTPTYALRLICDEELRTAVRSGVRRRQATDVTRLLCFEQLFPTPLATRASCEIYNDCSAVLTYVHTTVETSRCAACCSCDVLVSPLGYGVVYVSNGSNFCSKRELFLKIPDFLVPRW